LPRRPLPTLRRRDLALARATLIGHTVRLTVLEGADGSDRVCPMVAWYGYTLVHRPHRA